MFIFGRFRLSEILNKWLLNMIAGYDIGEMKLRHNKIKLRRMCEVNGIRVRDVDFFS